MLKDGHYEIGLLWTEDKPNLPYNRQLAVQRLHNSEKKLVRNPLLTEKYKNTIQDYLDQGYAQKPTSDQATNCTGITNYIPHHFVSSKGKPHKIRVAFDAVANYKSTPPRWNSPCRGEGAYPLRSSNQCINKWSSSE